MLANLKYILISFVQYTWNSIYDVLNQMLSDSAHHDRSCVTWLLTAVLHCARRATGVKMSSCGHSSVTTAYIICILSVFLPLLRVPFTRFNHAVASAVWHLFPAAERKREKFSTSSAMVAIIRRAWRETCVRVSVAWPRWMHGACTLLAVNRAAVATCGAGGQWLAW